jgi:hypothetical protein
MSATASKKLSYACVLNQHAVWHCNRDILRIDSTHMRIQNLYLYILAWEGQSVNP